MQRNPCFQCQVKYWQIVSWKNSYFVCAWRGVNLNRFVRKRLLMKFALIVTAKLINLSSQHTNLETHCLMYFCMFVDFFCSYIYYNLLVFPNNSGSICLIKLKIGMLYHMSNTYWRTVFYISVAQSVKGIFQFQTYLNSV